MRRLRAGRLVPALVAVFAVLASAQAASAHEDGENFLSVVNSVRPTVAGLKVSVAERDEALRLVNKTGKQIEVRGYEGEPYLLLLPNGVVKINDNSPTRYLNEDRYAQTGVPKSATPKAAPDWRTLNKQGVVEWHDHRIHWMTSNKPPKVKDAEVKTKVFDWTVPILVGSEKITVGGTLFWDPDDDDATGGGGSSPVLPIVGGIVGVLVIAGVAFFFIRRRGGERPPKEPKAPKAPKAESW
jgi:hypothetical protein